MPRHNNQPGKYNHKRRKFLQFLGLGGAALLGKSAAAQIRTNRIQDQVKVIENLQQGANYISIKLLRPDDLLSLELRYHNFSLTGSKLQPKGSPAYLVVIFQPQSIGEQAWSEMEGSLETPTIPGRIMIGGESRLVFEIPAGTSPISLTPEELLNWENYSLAVNDRAKTIPTRMKITTPAINQKINAIKERISNIGNNKRIPVVKGLSKDEQISYNNLLIPEQNTNTRRDAILNISAETMKLVGDPVGPPAELETSIEVPLRLYLSPTKLAGWKNLKVAIATKGLLKETNRLFELWHTRMGVKTNFGIDDTDNSNEQKLLRVLWADDAKKDYQESVPEKFADSILIKTSLTNRDRHKLVHESSNFQIPKFLPQPVRAKKLFLTTLGAWLTSEFSVDRKKLENAQIIQQRDGKDNALNVLSWKHIATMGRDHYVEIVKAGNIFPFGHEAVLVKITERKPHGNTGTAANFQRELIIITEPTKGYNYKDTAGSFRNFCFCKITMVTTTSPLLDPTKTPLAGTGGVGMNANNQFIIISKGNKPLFKMKAEDYEGNIIDFQLPLAFVSTDAQDNGPNIDALVAAYNTNFGLTSTASLDGQKFALAPKVENGCDTVYVAKNISFAAEKYVNPDELQGYLPIFREASIIEPSYQRLTGLATPVPVSLVDVKDPANKGQVFAKFNFAQAVNFAGNTDKTGGLALPNFNLSGLSRVAGAFGGDLNKFKNAASDAKDFFNVSSLPDPTLFGVFKLSDILEFVNNDSSFDLTKTLQDRISKIPNLTTEETEDAYLTSYVLKPKFKGVTIGDFVALTPGDVDGGFSINTQVKAFKDKTKTPEFSTVAAVKNFSVNIVKASSDYLVNVDFEHIKFEVYANKKPDVSVKMKGSGIRFGGPLSFINEVNKLIDPGGFDDPPYLDVSLTGVKCGYNQALPNLQLGAFTLSNLSLGAEVNLPFTGAPLTVGFRFCERQQPFTLTVSCLGGGGFFGLELDLHGLRQIEAALEFGAAASVNFGVASGSVSIMAGIYFKMVFESGQNSTQLTGYLRINGAVSVLGLITASIELYMAITYLMDKHKAYGEASLKIKVEVLFFSKTVTIHTQRTFAGSGSDPNFQTALTLDDWKTYCEAFAA